MQIPETPEYPKFELTTKHGVCTVTVFDTAPSAADVERDGEHAMPGPLFHLDAADVKINNIHVMVNGSFNEREDGEGVAYVWSPYLNVSRLREDGSASWNSGTAGQRGKIHNDIAKQVHAAITDRHRTLAHLARLHNDAEHAEGKAVEAHREYVDKSGEAKGRRARYKAFRKALEEQLENAGS